MSYYPHRHLNTFSQVANAYETITPLVSSRFGPDLNLRPIGKRSQVMEHIVKFSANCYGLFDGDIGDPIWDRYNPDGSTRNWPGEVTQYRKVAVRWERRPEWIDDKTAKRAAPILWERKRDGTEVITIRNISGRWSPNGRLAFLRAYTPRDMSIPYVSNGRQMVTVRGLGDFYLAKDPQVPASILSWHGSANPKYGLGYPNKPYRGDPAGLKFSRKSEHDSWEHVAGTGADMMVNRVRVDKDTKKKFKPALDELYLQVKAFYPMLTQGQSGWRLTQMIREEARELMQEHDVKQDNFYGPIERIVPDDVLRAAIKDPEHFMRTVVLKSVIAAMFENGTYEDERTFRAAYQREINRIANFTKTVWVKV